jgi:hypothetical protein
MPQIAQIHTDCFSQNVDLQIFRIMNKKIRVENLCKSVRSVAKELGDDSLLYILLQ